MNIIWFYFKKLKSSKIILELYFKESDNNFIYSSPKLFLYNINYDLHEFALIISDKIIASLLATSFAYYYVEKIIPKFLNYKYKLSFNYV